MEAGVPCGRRCGPDHRRDGEPSRPDVTLTIAVFAVATAAVVGVGPRLARIAEALANRYSISHVLVGAVLLGVVTSLPGLVLSR